ncbi:hypothetical protein D9M71_152260 [compost metagenome]
MLDTLAHPHRRPGALAVIVGRDGGIQGCQRGIGIQQRRAAQNHLFITLVTGQEDRAAHSGQGAVPAQQPTIHQVLALLDGGSRTVLFGNLGDSGEKVMQMTFCAHGLPLFVVVWAPGTRVPYAEWS